MRTLLATIASLTLASNAALACDYGGFSSAAEQAATSDIIFRGRAIETRVLNERGDAITSFEVIEPLKPPAQREVPPDRIDIRHGTDLGMCGVVFPYGQEALVIGNFLSDGHIYTGEADAPRWPESAYRAALAPE